MTKMTHSRSILLVVALVFTGFLFGCAKADSKRRFDEKEIQGLKSKTFFNDAGNVAATIATDGTRTIVAVPKTPISRQNQLNNDELTCLAKCVKIEDLEKRLNCILLCPTTKNWELFTY